MSRLRLQQLSIAIYVTYRLTNHLRHRGGTATPDYIKRFLNQALFLLEGCQGSRGRGQAQTRKPFFSKRLKGKRPLANPPTDTRAQRPGKGLLYERPGGPTGNSILRKALSGGLQNLCRRSGPCDGFIE